MDLSKYPLDLILVPMSLFLIAGYHTYIWHSSGAKQPSTAIGLITMKRVSWAQNILQDKNNNMKKDMLGVQSLRNSLMAAILSASVAILVNTGLAALVNNTYKYSNHLQHNFFGSQEGPTVVLKYASASLLLLFSFMTSSLAVWCIIEGSFLINASEELLFRSQAMRMLKRGFHLARVGNRVLYVTFPVLLWLLGPVPMAFSSLALVWVLYNLDFAAGTGLTSTQ